MGRVNIVKQVKIDGKWSLRSIPKKESGNYDWSALPDGDYFIEWRQDGRRRRQPAGNTAAQAMEAQRRKKHDLEACALGLNIADAAHEVGVTASGPPSLRKLVDRYLDQFKTLKTPFASTMLFSLGSRSASTDARSRLFPLRSLMITSSS